MIGMMSQNRGSRRLYGKDWGAVCGQRWEKRDELRAADRNEWE